MILHYCNLMRLIDYQNATPIRLVSRIDSASGAIDPGVMSWVTGYGLTKVSPPTVPIYLQKVQLPIVSNAQASTIWAGYYSFRPDGRFPQRKQGCLQR